MDSVVNSNQTYAHQAETKENSMLKKKLTKTSFENKLQIFPPISQILENNKKCSTFDIKVPSTKADNNSTQIKTTGSDEEKLTTNSEVQNKKNETFSNSSINKTNSDYLDVQSNKSVHCKNSFYVIDIPIEKKSVTNERSNNKSNMCQTNKVISNKSKDSNLNKYISKLSGIKLKAPVSSVDDMWNTITKKQDKKNGDKKKCLSDFKNNNKNANFNSNKNIIELNNLYKTSNEKTCASRQTVFSKYFNPDKTEKCHKTADFKNLQNQLNSKSTVDLVQLGCREKDFENMSESEHRIWTSLQNLDIPSWYLAYPNKNRDIIGLKNARSVNDIMADIEQLSLPGEQRLQKKYNFTISVPSLTLFSNLSDGKKFENGYVESIKLEAAKNQNNSFNLTLDNFSDKQNIHDLSQTSPQKNCSRIVLKPTVFTSLSQKHIIKHTKKCYLETSSSFLKNTSTKNELIDCKLPSDIIRQQQTRTPFSKIQKQSFNEIMHEVNVKSIEDNNDKTKTNNETKEFDERLVKQHVTNQANISVESPFIVKIRKIHDPSEIRTSSDNKKFSEYVEIQETHFGNEFSNVSKKNFQNFCYDSRPLTVNLEKNVNNVMENTVVNENKTINEYDVLTLNSRINDLLDSKVSNKIPEQQTKKRESIAIIAYPLVGNEETTQKEDAFQKSFKSRTFGDDASEISDSNRKLSIDNKNNETANKEIKGSFFTSKKTFNLNFGIFKSSTKKFNGTQKKEKQNKNKNIKNYSLASYLEYTV
ncbi:hypothetical protein HELRODRAFT_180319 [Helobdella robusta]|uniref:Uncharacterized protein n=1 Tax=Helobdella robusta TaxID=6412 RepID=T1FFQ7_HELRO|nr:hypothetical protein HELRODRAFT_180319 [Helobdella robusta]ESN93912.1 hypothetical protein HELRODRAFT_180319 [Helobdella robusta]